MRACVFDSSTLDSKGTCSQIWCLCMPIHLPLHLPAIVTP